MSSTPILRHPSLPITPVRSPENGGFPTWSRTIATSNCRPPGGPLPNRCTGEGSLLEPMKRFAHSMGVADRVRFLGRVSDENLPKVYAACDVFVLPSVSRLEAFGIVALEAMATAKPVIVADIPGVREVIEDGREGLLADPLNARDLAEKIRRLLADPEARRVMGERGREKVLESFGIERVTDQIEGVYRSVLDGRKGTTSRPCAR